MFCSYNSTVDYNMNELLTSYVQGKHKLCNMNVNTKLRGRSVKFKIYKCFYIR